MPSNKRYYIENLSITNINAKESDSVFSIYDFPHRFFISNNPYDDIVPQLTGSYIITKPVNNIFASNDIKDTSNKNFSYNFLFVKNFSGQGEIKITTVRTQTVFESYPIDDQKIPSYNNFYFNSSSNNYLCFCFFPWAKAPINLEQAYATKYSYSVNFDIIQE